MTQRQFWALTLLVMWTTYDYPKDLPVWAGGLSLVCHLAISGIWFAFAYKEFKQWLTTPSCDAPPPSGEA